jgi:hypothetical protein
MFLKRPEFSSGFLKESNLNPSRPHSSIAPSKPMTRYLGNIVVGRPGNVFGDASNHNLAHAFN